MKENVKLDISGFKETIELMSKTQEAFEELAKAIEQNKVKPANGRHLTDKEMQTISVSKDDNNNFNNHSIRCRCLECSDVAFRKLE